MCAGRAFTVSASDEECKKTIVDFWTDFRNNPCFSAKDDALAIITLRGTNVFLGAFAGLLDCARASRDAADFRSRIEIPRFVSAKVSKYFQDVKAILDDHEKRDVPIEEIWPFLKVIHALSFDLNTATRQTEVQYKNLLAFTASASDPVGAADSTWLELLREAGTGMTHAKSYRREDLSEQLVQRHSPVPNAGRIALMLLEEHSAVILDGIRTEIGADVHLSRDRLVQSLLEEIEASQIVVVTGPAGSGKSGIAKDAIHELADTYTFSFRADEFATAHLDETLQRAQLPINGVTLGALMAGQSRKVVLVESIERLLEASTREAFSDLLNLVKRDHSWRLVLTCRDYSSELIRSSLLQFVGVSHSVLPIPGLDDSELQIVESRVVKLSRPLSSPRLRVLLRNPYLLDKASQMDWPTDRPLPDDERAFRAKFWAEVIRADVRPADDMPRRRQDAFIEVALRRARALAQYVPRNDLDANAVFALRRDSLLSFSEQSDALVAPAHDVLEDWAILRWIEEQYVIGEQSLPHLSAAIGTHPAIRRTFRKWVTEIVVRNDATADRLFDSVINDSLLPPHFRDDTLVSLLQSSAADKLIQRHAASLFANNRELLRRIIHLLRVACVSTPSWLGKVGAAASVMHVPDGAAWESLLRVVESNLGSFDAADFPLLLGFVEDAAKGVSWQSPYPEGARSISAIAHWLLPKFDNYRTLEQQKRVLKIIAKFPRCNMAEFTQLLEDHEDRNRPAEEFRKIVLWGMEGMPACRDLPDIVIAAVRNDLVLTEEDLEVEHSFWGSMELEPGFGLRAQAGFHSFPASAYRGPFLQLLRYHPKSAVVFLIDLFNHSAEWYAARRVPMQYVEPPLEITLTFADGTTATQVCNSRLWNLHRGTSVGPYVLQSALMALEQWLLEVARARPNELDEQLYYILRTSRNAALTAVVASVATAHPRLASEALITLFSSPECILLDKIRLVYESQATAMKNMIPFRTAEQGIYDDERKEANSLPNRRHDLEAAIANVQLGPHCQRVQERIDEYLRSMPPTDEQTEQDQLWRLALHRMDLRQYTVASPYQEDSEALNIAAESNCQ